MAGVGLRLAVIAAMLVWVSAAVGARASKPPAGTFSGSYKVTIKVTNTKSTPSHWVLAAFPRCASVCRAPSFHQRLVSEKSWRSTILSYRWNGKGYALSKFFPRNADCVGKSHATVKKGYDVTSSQQIRVTAVSNGRVMRWTGSGKDDYVPNAAGRKHHCVAGEYDFVITSVAH